MRSLNAYEKERIKAFIKNGMDISELIKDVSIKNENLSHAIIKKFVRINDDISGSTLAYAKVGDEKDDKNIVQIINTDMSNCNWQGVVFLSPTEIRNCKANNSNFREVDAGKVDYRNTDFTGSTFCGAIMKIDSRLGRGCKFDVNFLKELTKFWNVEIEVKQKENKE